MDVDSCWNSNNSGCLENNQQAGYDSLGNVDGCLEDIQRAEFQDSFI